MIRDIRQAPFAWVAKNILRLIREHFDSSSQLTLALAIYLVLTEIASNLETNQFTTSYANIASKAGVSRRTVIRIMKQLEEIGIISIEERREGKRNLSNVISLLGGDSLTPVTGKKTASQSPFRINLEETIEQNKEMHVLFKKFWKQYPKKKAKKPALKSFQKINPDDELLSTMLAALETQKLTNDWTKEDGQFIPLPATWLNQARWEDEVPAQKVQADESDWDPS